MGDLHTTEYSDNNANTVYVVSTGLASISFANGKMAKVNLDYLIALCKRESVCG